MLGFDKEKFLFLTDHTGAQYVFPRSRIYKVTQKSDAINGATVRLTMDGPGGTLKNETIQTRTQEQVAQEFLKPDKLVSCHASAASLELRDMALNIESVKSKDDVSDLVKRIHEMIEDINDINDIIDTCAKS